MNLNNIDAAIDKAIATQVAELLKRLETAGIVLERMHEYLCEADRLAARWEVSGECTADEAAEIRAAKRRAEKAAAVTAEFTNWKEREMEALRHGRR